MRNWTRRCRHTRRQYIFDSTFKYFQVDTDGPSLCCGPDLVLALRHFVSGRKIHGYDENGALKYEICVDLPEVKLS